MIGLLVRALSWAARLLLAAFFAFVGYWKALGPIEALAEHRAWVAHAPDWLARAVGWSEIACAAALLTPAFASTRRVAFWGAAVLLVNQIIALSVHAAYGEGGGAAPQNLLICAVLAFVLATTRPQGVRT
jgi:uncharacterized membrane protein YphA (DoxX/SURF4 family)